MEAFWPGPLTLLLPRTAAVPDAVTAGRPLVGVRMPAHPVALELIRRAGVPVAAPSANLFGRTSPTTAAHVLEDLDGRIDAVLDAGPTGHGVESTVLDPCQSPMVIYRPGAVTAEQIRGGAGRWRCFSGGGELEETPGRRCLRREWGCGIMRPGRGWCWWRAKLCRAGARLAEAARAGLGAVGVMLPAEVAGRLNSGAVELKWGRWAAPEEMARELYAGLRALDATGCTVIVCPVPQGAGIGRRFGTGCGKQGLEIRMQRPGT
jgi:L-threonylcarbamoyladenylate synthase